jgi:MOSC domain-containing protein YiiM
METGRLLHICISARKGIAKHSIAEGNFVYEHGLEGDAHAGDWHRQVSLLAHLDIEFMRSKGLNLKPGAFGENLVIDGIDGDCIMPRTGLFARVLEGGRLVPGLPVEVVHVVNRSATQAPSLPYLIAVRQGR